MLKSPSIKQQFKPFSVVVHLLLPVILGGSTELNLYVQYMQKQVFSKSFSPFMKYSFKNSITPGINIQKNFRKHVN